MNCNDLFDAMREQPLYGWSCDEAGDFLRLLTPMRYPDGGAIELFVETTGDRIKVSDFGEAFRFLETYGLDPLRSPTRERMIELALKLGGARIGAGSIEIDVGNSSQIVESAVRLAQVITRVGDLALDIKTVAGSTFSAVVGEFLKTGLPAAEVTPNGVLEGRAARRQVDFVVKTFSGISAIEALAAASFPGANHQTAFTIKKFADLAAIEGAPRRFAVLDDAAGVWTESLRLQLGQFADVIEWQRREQLLSSL